MQPDVILGGLTNSKAVTVLKGIEFIGCTARLRADGRIVIDPPDRMPADLMETAKSMRDELALLLRALDPIVQARAQRFTAIWKSGSTMFLMLDAPLVQAGRCFSCGDGMPASERGRCPRCALAWRLAVWVQVVVDVARPAAA